MSQPSTAPGQALFKQTDVLAGLVFMAIGAGAYYLTWDLSMGSLLMVGSGFMPHVVAALLFLFGAGIFIGGVRKSGAVVEISSLRPLIAVTLCIAAFAITLERIGLIPAVLIVVALSTLAGAKANLIPLAAVGIVLALLCTVIFIWGAKLPIEAGPF